MKIQLYQTPDENSGKAIKESQTTLKAAKTATKETNEDFFIFLTFLIDYYFKIPFFLNCLMHALEGVEQD